MFYMYLFSFDKEEKYIYIPAVSFEINILAFCLKFASLSLMSNYRRVSWMCFDFRVLIFRALDL
jgi:hypothetical protein